MSFIEPLHDGERLLSGIGVFFVGVPLELRQVIGGGRRQLLLFLMQAGNNCILPGAGGNNALRLRAVEKAGLAFFIPVEGAKAVELRLHAEIFLWAEGADFLLTLHNQRERRRLHTPGGELCVVLAGERAGHVQANQPIRLRAALGGAVEIVILCGGL